MIGPSAPGWDPFEANLLRFADEMYRDSVVSDRRGTRCPALRHAPDDRRDDYHGQLPDDPMALNILGVQVNPGRGKSPIPSRQPCGNSAP
jgi:hypothetical protein